MVHEFVLLHFVKFEGSCSCSSGRFATMKFDLLGEKLPEAGIEEVPCAVVLVLLLCPLDCYVLAIALDDFFQVLMREWGYLLNSHYGDVLKK
jgi:hypothetical protein